MLNRSTPKYQLMLEDEVVQTLKVLRSHVTGSEEYVKTLSYIERLHSMMRDEKASAVSKDTLVTVGANLLGILMIIKHEHLNPITSKALAFVIRPRV